MNLLDTKESLSTKYARQAALIKEGAAYAYTMRMIDRVERSGHDLADYEVVFATDESIKQTDDGWTIKSRIRLVRRTDLDNLPVIGDQS